MHKIFLIIRKEYISRVRNKAFILTTLLTPLFIVLLIGGATFFSSQRSSNHKIAVIDKSGFLKTTLISSKEIVFDFPADVDTSNYISKGYTAILFIPVLNKDQKTEFTIRSEKGIGWKVKKTIEKQIDAAIEEEKLLENGISKAQLDSIRNASHQAELITQQQSGSEVKESSEGLAYGIGYGAGILIYFTMLTYGMMVFKGVSEEKTNRIVEVIISSVKPFQLMMGKIVGIGLVGLTQFLLWIVLLGVLSVTAQFLISPETLEQVKLLQQNGGMIPGGAGMASASEGAVKLYTIQHTISTINWPMISGCFLFYFIGGYLFYAALFAAVGSVSDEQGAQGLTIPITLPLVFSFFIMTSTVQAPDSSLAIWASIIPFTSPSVMLARIAYGVPGTVPYWQLIVSMLSMIAGFLFTTWMAGKIYRTGLLMYGKKVTWREMLRWAFYTS